VTGTSYDIDVRFKAILQEGLSVYRVDAEKLDALRPDIGSGNTESCVPGHLAYSPPSSPKR
jgi:hypothetical protein